MEGNIKIITLILKIQLKEDIIRRIPCMVKVNKSIDFI